MYINHIILQVRLRRKYAVSSLATDCILPQWPPAKWQIVHRRQQNSNQKVSKTMGISKGKYNNQNFPQGSCSHILKHRKLSQHQMFHTHRHEHSHTHTHMPTHAQQNGKTHLNTLSLAECNGYHHLRSWNLEAWQGWLINPSFHIQLSAKKKAKPPWVSLQKSSIVKKQPKQ